MMSPDEMAALEADIRARQVEFVDSKDHGGTSTAGQATGRENKTMQAPRKRSAPASANGQATHPPTAGEVIPVVLTMADVKPCQVDWIWPRWIPRRAITLIDGDPGLGKSTITLDLAARVSRGWAMPSGDDPQIGPAGVLLLSAEDDPAATIRPRLNAADADVSRVHLLEAIRLDEDERPPVLPWDLDRAETFIHKLGIVLVVVDPIMAYLDSQIDAHKDQDVRRCLHSLKSLAERTGVAIVIVRHLNKLTGPPALYRGGGSIGIMGAVRSAMLVGRHPNEPDQCVMAPTKCNLCAMPKSLTYALEPYKSVSRIGWIGDVDLTADDLLDRPRHKRTTTDQCAAALMELLAAGPKEVGVVDAALGQLGYSPAAVKRARQQLRIRTQRVGFGPEGRWMLSLPVKETKEDQAP
jgi:hypothetical protein